MRVGGGAATRTRPHEVMVSPAPLAQALYAETPQSGQARQQDEQARRLAAEPARAIEQGRPTKRDRRAIDSARGGWRRWSASIDDE